MKKVLFIDRDGTLIRESPGDFQVDSLEKLEFMPAVFRNLYMIRNKLDYELVIVTNQDGLGTKKFPEEKFWPVHKKMIRAFENEGITFDDQLIDRSFPEDNAPTRKPRLGMMMKYLDGTYDIARSFVIGDRLTDIEMAKNIGALGILIGPMEQEDEIKKAGLKKTCIRITQGWDEIYAIVASHNRFAKVTRKTAETEVSVIVELDGKGSAEVKTGLGFFDHMLDQIARHSGCNLTVSVQGDLHVDEHHTIEDTALALGEAIRKALGNKTGIGRYGFVVPMDDCLAQVAIDFSGRSWLVWEVKFKREKIGDVPTEMFSHFFKSFCDAAGCNLNIKAEGGNEHHKTEAVFKAFARALRMAVQKDLYSDQLPSTKGLL
ncbi:MAG: bifunctional histidinol-phosphatase/imidazoleglycerol-phosphate dehydratase HisB [Bacteroidales bacterium]|nr:bifunctional histidinol-phosphatase/imidazoleglycerol-phosphate dehydratase HisB [Bacteroidales bacterium]